MAFRSLLKISRIEMTAVMLVQTKRKCKLTCLSDIKSPNTVYKINNHPVVFVPLQMKLNRQLAFTYYNKVSNGHKASYKSLKEYYY